MSPFPLATKEGEGGGASAAERITAEFSRAVSKANRFMDADTSSNNGVVVVVVVVVVERFFFFLKIWWLKVSTVSMDVFWRLTWEN